MRDILILKAATPNALSRWNARDNGLAVMEAPRRYFSFLRYSAATRRKHDRYAKLARENEKRGRIPRGFSRASTSWESTVSIFPVALAIKSVDIVVIKKKAVASRGLCRPRETEEEDSLVVEMNAGFLVLANPCAN